MFGTALRMPGVTFINEGKLKVEGYLEVKKIDNSQGQFICNEPEMTIKAQEFIGFDRADLAIVRQLTLIDMKSNLNLDRLSQQAPNLEQLTLNNCSGLAASPANVLAYHQLKLRGINITLEGMQDFQNSYGSTYPAETNVTLPQAMIVPDNIINNLSNATNLTSLRRDSGNSEQLPADRRIE